MEQNFLKDIFRIVLIALFPIFALGQSNYINNQFWLQMPLYNPAASGVFNDLEIATGIQYQDPQNIFGYKEIDMSNPEMYVRGDFFIAKANSGFGLNYLNTNLNQLFKKEANYRSQQYFGLNYNYQFRFNENNLLSVGLSLNAENENWNINWLTPTPGPDPSIPSNKGSTTDYNIGAGLLFKNRVWFAGVSMNPMIKLKENETRTQFQERYNYVLISGLDLPLGEKYQLYSTLLISSYLSADHVANLMAQISYNKIIYLGGALTTSSGNADGWQAIIGVRIAKKYRVHYAYGQAISDLTTQSGAIHNISIQFVLDSFHNN